MFDENGDATYGVTLHNGLYINLIYSSGEQLVTLDAKGMPQYTAPSERYYSVVEKLASMVATQDGWAVNQHDGIVCLPVFKNNRTLFHYWELKETSVLRDMEEDYGVLPSPKFDESQDSYYSMISHQSAMMAVPVTNTKLDMAGTVMDYMSYLSNESLWPAYLDVTVINKGLRDEDSVEMMSIIRETLGIDVGLVYGWSNALTNDIATKIKAGDAAIASIASSYTDTIRTAIEESLSAWNN